MPGGDLQTARKELWEAKEWLLAVQKKNVPPSPRPETLMRREPTSPPKVPRGQSEVGDQGNKARNEASMLPQSMGKRGSKVSNVDQIEHLLAGGQWEGLGVVHKGGEIHIEVRPRQCRIRNG